MRDPVVAPATAGVKVRLSVHEEEPARELVQVFAEIAKAGRLVTMLPNATADVAAFFTVTV